MHISRRAGETMFLWVRPLRRVIDLFNIRYLPSFFFEDGDSQESGLTFSYKLVIDPG